ncbi:MAG: outer membrane beta-barrel protein [Bacteroidetes bacterium]|nr:outer membrane beta-barrel protein [Bacteroidota bacterium]
MIRTAAFCMLTIGLILMLHTNATAQRRGNTHGFQQTYPGAIAIGVSAGANFNFGVDGPANVCDCDFEGGSGIGYHAGLHLDIMVNRVFGLRLQGLFEDHSSIYEVDRIATTYTQDGQAVEISTRRRDEVEIQYLSTAFLITWFTGPQGLYLLSGASAGFFLEGNIRDEEFLLTPGHVYSQTGTNQYLVSDAPLDAGSDPQIRGGLVLGVGYDFALGRGMAVAPEFQMDYPLTSVVEGNADWRIPTLRASIALRFGL